MERMKREFCGRCLGINATNGGYRTFVSVYHLAGCSIPTAAMGCSCAQARASSLALADVLKKKALAAPPQVRKHGGAFEHPYYPYWHKCADSCERNIATDRTPRKLKHHQKMQPLSFADLVSGASLFKKKGEEKSRCFVTMLWPSFLIITLS